jgi:outer membrane protein assembly factor BamA
VYLAHAFLNVKFDDPAVRVEANKVVVQAPIDRGPAFTWNGVTWSGNDAIPSADLNKLVDLNPGASADGMKIQTTWESVRSAFEKLGYLDVALAPAPHFDDATKQASYNVKVTEGPQYHMGNLVLSGLSMEGERRLRAAWKIAPGAVFDESTYQNFLDSGIKEAFVGLPIHYQTIQKFLDKHPTEGKINVMLNFE